MKDIDLHLNKVVAYLIIVAITVALLYVGRQILVPLSFAMIAAFLLYPVCKFLERRIYRIPGIIVSFLLVFAIIASVLYLFGTKFYALFENLKDFTKNIQIIITRITGFIDDNILGETANLKEIYDGNRNNIFDSVSLLEKTFNISTAFLANFGLVIVYTFLFLLYRTSFKNFIIQRFAVKRKQEQAERLLVSIQKVAQNYFYGLFIIIIILGVLNGTGLWLIGVDYPFLFGFFAAFLAVIPYIGTFIGGLLPTLYAVINNDSLVPALLVVGWYVIVQTIEGNILTPKIVGARVSINPLFALIALLTGGVLWGIAGLVLFIPFVAIVKVIFEHVEQLKPYAQLLSSDFGYNKHPLVTKISGAAKNVFKNKENR